MSQADNKNYQKYGKIFLTSPPEISFLRYLPYRIILQLYGAVESKYRTVHREKNHRPLVVRYDEVVHVDQVRTDILGRVRRYN